MPRLTEEMVDGLTVRPGLHEPGSDTGTDAHVGARPFDTFFRVSADESVRHLLVKLRQRFSRVAVLCAVEPHVGNSYVATSLLALRHSFA